MKELLDALYDAQYLKVLRDLKTRSQWVSESLSRPRLKKITEKGFHYLLSKVDPCLKKKMQGHDFYQILFGLDKLFFGKDPFVVRMKECCDLLNITDWDLGFLLFYTAPKSFFPPDPLIFNFFELPLATKESTSFLQYSHTVLKTTEKKRYKEVFSTPMELYAALVTIQQRQSSSGDHHALVDSEDEKLFSDFIDSAERLNLYRLQSTQIEWMRDFCQALSTQQKDRLLERMKRKKIHPYIRRITTLHPKQGVVVDGSNIIFSGRLQPDPLRLKDLMNALGIFPTLFFPVLFVFDANVDYVIGSEKPFWNTHFQKNPNVIRFSPADEWIIKKAYEQKYAVITNDQYRQHRDLGLPIIQFLPHQARLAPRG